MRIQDKLNKLKNKRGFTLVELMIVVAIIGVLAALAIYGVRKYLTNAKSAEARTGIGRIAKDASSAFEREKMAAGVIPVGDSAAIGRELCVTAASVPDALAKVGAKKYQSEVADWNGDPGWACLRFTMSEPQYFMYTYTQAGTGVDVAGGTFEAKANGDLDNDGVASSFTIKGELRDDGGELIVGVEPSITEADAEE